MKKIFSGLVTFRLLDFKHFFSMRLEGGPWFVGLDELIRHYSHGPNGLPCQLLEPCPGDPLPPELLASGPGMGAKMARI